MPRMPVLPVNQMVLDLPPYEEALIRAAFHKTGRMRATKPYRKITRPKFEGSANYVWRMLCFDFCDFRPHSCMPVCADFDLPGDYDERRAKVKILDKLIKRVESVIPVTAQKGIMRWGKTLSSSSVEIINKGKLQTELFC